MGRFLLQRLLLMIPTVFFISVVSFVIIQLPPGDFLTTMLARLEASGRSVDAARIQQLELRYGLNQPIHEQYITWMTAILTRGDFGQSFGWNKPVSELILERLPITIALALATLLLGWLVAFPIGIYSAVRQYSVGDYVFTIIGFLGLAVPSFMIALILMYIGFAYFGQSPGGLQSPQFRDAPWSWDRFYDLLQHLWVPIVVIGAASTAALIRILRANLLDELHKPYVIAARARGVPEKRLILRYPLRVALNPFVSTVGWVLPAIVAGEVIVAEVLSLPTTGPLLLEALRTQDMYLAGSIIFLISVLTVVGTLLSDVLLAFLDPRIRLGYSQ